MTTLTLSNHELHLITYALADKEVVWYKRGDGAEPGRQVYCELMGEELTNIRHKIEKLLP